MSVSVNPDPTEGFPDEIPQAVESDQETRMEKQEKRLENKEKEGNEQPSGETFKTITDVEKERKSGSQEDQARADGPYGVQEDEPEM
jgi:hypothetical protein